MISACQITCVRETEIWQTAPYTVINSPKLATAYPYETYPYKGKFVDAYGGVWYRISDVKAATSQVLGEGYISAEDSRLSFGTR